MPSFVDQEQRPYSHSGTEPSLNRKDQDRWLAKMQLSCPDHMVPLDHQSEKHFSLATATGTIYSLRVGPKAWNVPRPQMLSDSVFSRATHINPKRKDSSDCVPSLWLLSANIPCFYSNLTPNTVTSTPRTPSWTNYRISTGISQSRSLP